jgi:exodeoxyribonuclease-3
MARIIKIMSWNVNGIRSLLKKGFVNWLQEAQPDILCLQEVKIQPDQLPQELVQQPGYEIFWNCAERKGYSGVAVFSREKPIGMSNSMGIPKFDAEGRLQRLDFDTFTLFNVYFPNGKMGPDRLQFKMDFYDAFLSMTEQLRSEGKSVIFVGDVNTAHNEIDIARPKENSKISGFLPIEREWMDKLDSLGYVDTFRKFYPDTVQYSWWDLKSGARKRNVGWRLDYVYTTPELLDRVKSAYILPDVEGSDHCPVGIDLAIP